MQERRAKVYPLSITTSNPMGIAMRVSTEVSLAHRLRLFATGVVVVLGGSFHFGYQISLINPMADVLQSFLEKGLRELLTTFYSDQVTLRLVWATIAGLMFVGALLGALVASPMLETWGSRRSLSISTLVLIASFTISAAAKWLVPVMGGALLFTLGRFLSGVGIGMVTTIQTVYLSEISPIEHRGAMGTLTGFSTSVGFFVASGVGLPHALGREELWPYAYLVECLPSLVLLAALISVLHDSPLYLLRLKKEEAAIKCLRLYHPAASIPTHLAALRKESATVFSHNSNEKQGVKLMGANPNPSSGSSSHSPLLRVLSQAAPRQALLICTLLNATVGFSGIMAVSFFGTFLLQGIGFSESSAAVANCVASLSGIAGNLAGSYAVDKIGRRRLIIGGLSMLALLNALLMLLVYAFHYSANVRLGYAFLAIFMLFLFTFSFGVGPMAWFLATELSTARDRSLIQSLAVSCQYLTCFVSPLLFFPLYQSGVDALSFLLFILPLLFTTSYLWLRLPETKNRRIDQIVRELEQRGANKGLKAEGENAAGGDDWQDSPQPGVKTISDQLASDSKKQVGISWSMKKKYSRESISNDSTLDSNPTPQVL